MKGGRVTFPAAARLVSGGIDESSRRTSRSSFPCSLRRRRQCARARGRETALALSLRVCGRFQFLRRLLSVDDEVLGQRSRSRARSSRTWRRSTETRRARRRRKRMRAPRSRGPARTTPPSARSMSLVGTPTPAVSAKHAVRSGRLPRQIDELVDSIPATRKHEHRLRCRNTSPSQTTDDPVSPL